MNKLLSLVADLDQLYGAWREVRSQVRRTAWPQLLEELAQFEASPLRILRQIQNELERGSYRFSSKWAYAKRKSGGSRRGVTVMGLRDRVVQRSMLNVIFSADEAVQQHLGEIPSLIRTPTSFAGVPGRGVPEAIEMAMDAIRRGACAYAYSDMKDFFPCVPRQEVVELLRSHLRDQAFLQLFSDALETELANQADVQEWLKLFPLSEIGVAQGSLLSTLVGNLCLRNFDRCLNNDKLLTVRYLDDFLILTSDAKSARDGFELAKQELARLGMRCYEPGDGSNKSGLGRIHEGINFLGCHLHPDGVSPARSACKKLLHDVGRMVAQGKKEIARFLAANHRRRTEAAYVQTLYLIDRKIRGWGDVYRFVSNRLPFTQLDDRIQQTLDEFRLWFARATAQLDRRTQRRMTGIALLSDTPPIKSEGADPEGL